MRYLNDESQLNGKIERVRHAATYFQVDVTNSEIVSLVDKSSGFTSECVRRLGQKRKTKYGAGRKKESAIRTLRKLSPDDTRKRKRIARGIQADRDNYQEPVPLPSRAGPVAKRDYDKKALADRRRQW